MTYTRCFRCSCVLIFSLMFVCNASMVGAEPISTFTATPTATPTASQSPTASPTLSITAGVSGNSTSTTSPTDTPVPSATPTPTSTPNGVASSTATATLTSAASATASATATATVTATATATATSTSALTLTATPTVLGTATTSPTRTAVPALGGLPTQAPASAPTLSFKDVTLWGGAGGLDTEGCGITADGIAYCWGTNSYGQLGSGEAYNATLNSWPDHAFPWRVAVAPDVRFTALRASNVSEQRRVCALTTAGGAWCWGTASSWNYEKIGANTPVPLPLPPGQTLIDLSVAPRGSQLAWTRVCGVGSAGTVLCWTGMGTDADPFVLAVLTSPAGVTFTSVLPLVTHTWGGPDSSRLRTCALSSGGDVYCSGFISGPLFTPNVPEGQDPNLYEVPVLTLIQPTIFGAPAGTKFRSIFRGQAWVCGVSARNRAYCPQNDFYGSFGDIEWQAFNDVCGITLGWQLVCPGIDTPVSMPRELRVKTLSDTGMPFSGRSQCVRTDSGEWACIDFSANSGNSGSFRVPSWSSTPALFVRENVMPQRVRVTNVQDRSLVISWVTNLPTVGMACVRVGSACQDDQFRADERGPSTMSRVHRVTFAGLTPETTYPVELRSSLTGNSSLTTTTGKTLPLTAPNQVFGTVTGNAGGDGVLVYLNAQNENGTSSMLSTLVVDGDEGTWIINLGSLRSLSGETSFPVTQGTFFAVAAEGGPTQTSLKATDLPGALSGETTLSLSTSVAVPLDVGWNLVTLPVVPSATVSASAVCASLGIEGPGSQVEVNRWVNGGWEGHRCGLPPNNFTLQAGQGYFIRAARSVAWNVFGTAGDGATVRDLQSGWNLVGAPGVSTSPSTTKAADVCARLNTYAGATVSVEVDRWIYGGWDGHLCGKTPHNFDIEGGKGYLVRLTKPSRWSAS